MANKIKEINGKEVIINALLEASQNLLNKIDNNIKKINELEIESNRGIYKKEKKEKVKDFIPDQEQNSMLNR